LGEWPRASGHAYVLMWQFPLHWIKGVALCFRVNVAKS